MNLSDLNDIKMGIYFRLAYDKYFGMCNCGQCMIPRDNKNIHCDKCGNKSFYSYGYVNKESFKNKEIGVVRHLVPHFEVLKQSASYLKIKKTNMSISIDFDNMQMKIIKENMKMILEYDFVNSFIRGETIKNNNKTVDFDSKKDDEKESEMYEKMLNYERRFFRNLDEDIIYNTIEDKLIHYYTLSRYLANSNRFARRRNNTIWGGYNSVEHKSVSPYGLYLMLEHKELQILISAGISRANDLMSPYGNEIAKVVRKGETKPHKILGIPKFMIKHLKECDSIPPISTIRDMSRFLDGNNMKQMVDIALEESDMRSLINSWDKIRSLIELYNYKNIKKLSLYIFREVRLTQGIRNPQSASELLRDYVRMSILTGNEDYDKYPKSLKKDHDIATLNYEAISDSKDDLKKKEFSQVVNTDYYKEFIYEPKNSDYVIIPPKEPKDLTKEGKELSHCIGSYVTDVIKGNCKIYFLRSKKDIDKPLASIEVKGRNIRQARRANNHVLTDNMKEFVKEWSENKGLMENYYY